MTKRATLLLKPLMIEKLWRMPTEQRRAIPNPRIESNLAGGMMRYIDRVLQPGEQILYSSKLHWMIYLPSALALIIAIGIFGFAPFVDRDAAPMALLVGIVVIVFAVFMFVGAWIERWTTEIEVTDRRVVHKRGLIRRETVEMNMDKVESVDVNQSILGRVFDYGDVIVRGTGVGWRPLRKIEAPLMFRNHIIAR